MNPEENKTPGRKIRSGKRTPPVSFVFSGPLTPERPYNDGLLQALPTGLSDVTTVRVGNDEIEVNARDLLPVRMLGEGQFGTVDKVTHTKSGRLFAAKKVRFMLDSEERKRTLREMDVAMRSTNYPYTVMFYGALFYDGDAIILMEVMNMNLRDLYTRVYAAGESIPEEVLRVIIYSLVSALDFLNREMHIMHRDIKPTNVLANRAGHIKLCDFGICGELIDSIASTGQIGSRPYLAPERIKPDDTERGYTVRSDVWALGITVLELAIGRFPYKNWTNIFDQLNDVVYGNPPQLPTDTPYSPHLRQFLEACLKKVAKERLRYEQLLELPLIVGSPLHMGIADYVCRFILPEED